MRKLAFLRVGLAACAVAGTATLASLARGQAPPSAARAQFTAAGEVELPVGYRQWRHVGTRYKPIGVSILDGMTTKTPEIYNAYVEPRSFTTFERTGHWPDGTQIVKEFSAVQVGPGCDEKTFLCTSKFGVGIFETGFVGLGMMVKDARRFPDAPGHWGYFEFGHKSPPYNAASPVRSQRQCGYCHVNLASDSDYVIAAAHIGLSGERP